MKINIPALGELHPWPSHILFASDSQTTAWGVSVKSSWFTHHLGCPLHITVSRFVSAPCFWLQPSADTLPQKALDGGSSRWVPATNCVEEDASVHSSQFLLGTAPVIKECWWMRQWVGSSFCLYVSVPFKWFVKGRGTRGRRRRERGTTTTKSLSTGPEGRCLSFGGRDRGFPGVNGTGKPSTQRLLNFAVLFLFM